MVLTAAAAGFLPEHLGMPAGVVQEWIMIVLLPVFLIFVWWTW